MQSYITFSFIIPLVTALVLNETTKEDHQKNVSKQEVQDISAFNTNGNSFWVHQPISQVSEIEGGKSRTIFKSPHKLTRLAKTYSFNFEPIFNRGPFEPFERRPRPVTLVAFRKNGFIPRRFTTVNENRPLEIAELQSPFNEVSDVWQKEPEE